MSSYMDRKKCYHLYFYTHSECKDCPKLKECREEWRKTIDGFGKED